MKNYYITVVFICIADPYFVTVLSQVCITLAHLAGNPHQRFGAVTAGTSQAAVNHTIHRVVKVINQELKEEFLKFPSNMELELLAEENLD